MKYIIQDSSFVISLFDEADPLHKPAIAVNSLLLEHNNLKIIIPTTVFQETMFNLIRNGYTIAEIKPRLLNLILIGDVINYQITETSLIKLINNFQRITQHCRNQDPNAILRTSDSTIVGIAMEFEDSCILTSDRGMKNTHQGLMNNIFCFNDEKDLLQFKKFLES